ncbi:MAG: fumarate hydratase [Candidatus Heimdallarchaeota archaeon]|nr:fumarate hydratase [Candidatus Heimdallarchaeota archaeon]MCK4771208.1 fumarate hydratase [Candidatus Heimdallarchaeota archaeon]
MKDIVQVIEDTAAQLLKTAATILPTDVKEILLEAEKKTEGALGKSQLQAINENVKIAEATSKPMCQDTGLISFFVKIGDEFPLRSEVKIALIKATEKATSDVPLRPNAVDMFEGNTKNNVGLRGYVPWFYFDLVEGDSLEIIALPKGGGSSNVGKMKMIPPGKGIKGVKEFVVEVLAAAGPLACPPYTVGVGVGGGEDMCMNLAKKALLRPLFVYHKDETIANLEKELLQILNRLEIGAMGLGEGPSILDVHMEFAARHPASLPVGVVISCWALRHAGATVDKEGNVEWHPH